MILNYIYFGFIIISIISLTSLINNLWKLISKKGSSSSYTEKSKEKIEYYKKKSFLSSAFLVFSLIFIILYIKPLLFSEIIDIKDWKDVDSISMHGNISGPDIKSLNSNYYDKIIDLLNNYKYKRTFSFDDIGLEVEFLIINNNFIEIRDGGYLRTLDGRVYKIKEKNKEKLYDSLKIEINNILIAE